MDREEEEKALRRPLASLMSKSEKAREKLSEGTWQYKMLGNNVTALGLAMALMDGGEGVRFSVDELEKALEAFADMIARTEKSMAKFFPGTSQHTLQKNRLHALLMAQNMIKQKGRDE